MAAVQRVLIVEDHELLANTLTFALRARGYEVDHTAAATDEALVEQATRFQPTVVLLDLDLGPGRTSIPLIRPLRERGAWVLMLTATTDRMRLAQCVEAGADGLLTKTEPLEEVVRAVEEVAEHGSLLSRSQRDAMLAGLRHRREEQRARLRPFDKLTRREQEVLAALVEGKTAQTIAKETFTSIRTVRGHIQTILDKLGVRSQLTAVAKAKEAGWPEP